MVGTRLSWLKLSGVSVLSPNTDRRWRPLPHPATLLRALEAEAVVSLYSGHVPESLEAITSEERNQLYRMLRINVRVHVDGTMDI